MSGSGSVRSQFPIAPGLTEGGVLDVLWPEPARAGLEAGAPSRFRGEGEWVCAVPHASGGWVWRWRRALPVRCY